jgi:hypothetical protein
MRHPILLSLALLFAGIAASAQNLNPVVEVTNTYEQAATGIEKPDQIIAVPDSLLRFNLDMDYEMRTTPYKGAYEFNPYLVELKPMPRYTGEGTLFVRVGAGYGLHPEADIVWSPVKADNFRLNLYANHHSYFGKYRTMQYQSGEENGKRLFRGDKENLYDGAESNTSAGVNTLLNWKSGSWTTDLHYQHLFASDTWTEYHHHVAALQTRVKSAPQNRFYYNLGLRGNYLVRGDNMKGGIISADGGIGANRKSSQARLDFFGEAIITQELRSAGQIGFIPRFVFRMGNLHFNLGLKVAFILRSQDDFYPSNGGYVFPDVHIDYRVVPEDFILYASATGGNKMQGYAPLLQQNHFLPSFSYDGFDVEVEHVNVAAGARGNIGRRFHYDTKIGYALYSNAVLWGFGVINNLGRDGYAPIWHPSICRENYGLFYADFAGGWKSEHLDIDTHLRYQYSSLKGDNYMVFAPAAFVAQAKIMYNWGDRIKVGVDLDASTDRLAQDEEGVPVFGLPGYADLGLYAEYGFTRKFAIWVRGGNLLNMEVQRTPFHAERGIYFTAGLQYHF